MSLKQKIPTKHGDRIRTTIYGPDRLFTKIKNQAVDDGLSFNQRMIQLLISGLRSEQGQRDRENSQLLHDIKTAVKEQYRIENQAAYGHLERPLNRYEKLKEERKELYSPTRQAPEEPDYDREQHSHPGTTMPDIPAPRDDFENIYGGSTGEKYSGDIDDDVVADWARSNFHPWFTK